MERHFDLEFQKAKTDLMAMGTEAMHAISKAAAGLSNKDVKQLNEVFAIEQVVDLMNISVDEKCLKLLALQSPLAKDLRLVIAMIKTNADIERIADQATNLARIGCDYLAGEALAMDLALAGLAAASMDMVQDALQSFMNLDLMLARSILVSDEEVDRARDRMVGEVLQYLKSCPDKVVSGLHLILLAGNFERIADHATNIAENAIFVMSGEDIRHHGPPTKNGRKNAKTESKRYF